MPLQDIEFNKHKLVARFGIMHMIATNLCEWLYVLVEETKHEIHHLAGNAKFFYWQYFHDHFRGESVDTLFKNFRL